MAVTDHRNAAHWYCCGKNYLLFDIERKVFINKGNAVTNFRGEETVIRSISRGPEHNGTAKVTVEPEGCEYYSTVYELIALPAIEAGKVYQLDIYDRHSMVRHLELVRIVQIDDNRVLNVFDVATGKHYFVDWSDVFIANEDGVHAFEPVR